MNKLDELSAARDQVAKARLAVEAAKTKQLRAEAYEMLEFWTNKTAFLSASDETA